MSFRVILIDDEETDIRIASSVIASVAPNAKLHVIRDGETALAYLTRTEPPGQPSIRLVLLDLGLPRTDGFEILHELGRIGRRASLPIVVFSVKDSTEIIRRAYDLGAFGYIVKPGDPEELRRKLEIVLQYWLKANADPMPQFGSGGSPEE